MQTFNDVLIRFRVFLEESSYLVVVPCRWGYVRLFNEGEHINYSAVICQKPEELYNVLAKEFEKEFEVRRMDN